MSNNINKKNIFEYILKKIEQNIIENNLVKDNDKIVVGVSGGPDSMCLLDSLIKLKNKFNEKYNISYSIAVAHVNHMIREESKTEKVYVEEFCKKYDIPFYYLEEDVKNNSKKEKMSEETYGRKIRYEFFENVRVKENADVIATAHNMDDDIETILLNMIRGTGLKGLTGMSYKYKNIIRPILNIEKCDILEYNTECNLNPCIDKTNFENIYSRNKIRNILIPTLKDEYNSNIKQSIIRMKSVLEKDEEFLNNYTQNIVNNALIDNNINSVKFNFSTIMKEHESIKLRSLRKILEIKCRTLDGIGNVHIMDIKELLENNIKGKKYIIGNKFTIEIIKKNIAVIY